MLIELCWCCMLIMYGLWRSTFLLHRVYGLNNHVIQLMYRCVISMYMWWTKKLNTASISTTKGYSLPWVHKILYLETYIITDRQFRRSVSCAKRSFHRSTNAIFWFLWLGGSKFLKKRPFSYWKVMQQCLPVLLYGLDCCSLLKAYLH